MKTLYVDDKICLASHKNIISNLWGGEFGVHHLEECEAQEHAFVKEHGRMGILTIIKKPGKMVTLPADVRNKATELIKIFGPYTIAQAHVVLGTGFWVATVRSFISATQVFMPTGHPVKIFDSLESAAAWLAPQLNTETKPPLVPDDVLQLGQHAIAAFDKHAIRGAAA